MVVKTSEVIRLVKEPARLWVAYSSLESPSKPTGTGTTNGWSDTPSDSTKWYSQKVSESRAEGEWEKPILIKGEHGLDGCMPRIQGVWNKDTTYIYNNFFRDIVLHNNKHYALLVRLSASINQNPATNPAVWEEMVGFKMVATEVLLADSAWIDIIGTNGIAVGANASNRWELTEGMIKHTKNGIKLSADGDITYAGKWHLANDGSGYLACRSITWTKEGVFSLGSGTSNITYNPTTKKISLGAGVTLASGMVGSDAIGNNAITIEKLSADVRSKLADAFDTDNKLTPSEKQSILQIWTDIESTFEDAKIAANLYVGSHLQNGVQSALEELTVAYNTLYMYLFVTIHPDNTLPLMENMNVSSIIDSNALRQTISYYYIQEAKLDLAKGSTIISGGYLKTDIIKAGSIHGDRITGNTITSLGSVTAGTFRLGNGAFNVNAEGKLTATGAEISGKITIGAGSNVYTKDETTTSIDTAKDAAIKDAGIAADGKISEASKEIIRQSTVMANNAEANAKTGLAVALGYTSYDNMYEAALAKQTIINGGFIRTSLIEADSVVANGIKTNVLTIPYVESVTDNGIKFVDSTGAEVIKLGVGGLSMKKGVIDISSTVDEVTTTAKISANELSIANATINNFKGAWGNIDKSGNAFFNANISATSFSTERGNIGAWKFDSEKIYSGINSDPVNHDITGTFPNNVVISGAAVNSDTTRYSLIAKSTFKNRPGSFESGTYTVTLPTFSYRIQNNLQKSGTKYSTYYWTIRVCYKDTNNSEKTIFNSSQVHITGQDSSAQGRVYNIIIPELTVNNISNPNNLDFIVYSELNYINITGTSNDTGSSKGSIKVIALDFFGKISTCLQGSYIELSEKKWEFKQNEDELFKVENTPEGVKFTLKAKKENIIFPGDVISGAVPIADVANKVAHALTVGSKTFDGSSAVTLTKSDVGLGSVTNESKATMFASPTFTGTPVAPTASTGTKSTQIANAKFVQDELTKTKNDILGGKVKGAETADKVANALTVGSKVFDGSAPVSVTKTDVGLGNVTNESKGAMFTSPSFTGTPVAPTAPAGTNTTQIATTSFVQTRVEKAISDLINGSGTALDTLKELADALGNDPNFAATITTKLGDKFEKSDVLNVLTYATNNNLKALSAYQGYLLNNVDIKAIAVSTKAITLTRNDNSTLTANIPTWNQNTTGNAATSTKLQNARTFSITVAGKTAEQTFNGSANATFNIALSSLIAGNNSYIIGSNYNGSGDVVWSIDASTTATANKIAARDGSGYLYASRFIGDLQGLADKAKILNTARRINGVSFNGSSDITIKSMPDTIILANATDLNTITETGFYATASAASGDTMINKPSASGAFSLIVERRSSASYITQTIKYANIGNPMLFVRILSGSWGAWQQKAAISDNVASATKLLNTRIINVSVSGVYGNGQNFDGTGNITIPVTLNTLSRGSYLTGNHYNGGSATTWAVDASSSNVGGKVVARNSSGDFAARNITASLLGNATTATSIALVDTRSVDDLPEAFKKGVYWNLKLNTACGSPSQLDYSGILTLSPWSDFSGGFNHQLAFNNSKNISYRTGNATGWDTSWKVLLDSDNTSFGTATSELIPLTTFGSTYNLSLSSHLHDDRYLKLDGGTITGNLDINGKLTVNSPSLFKGTIEINKTVNTDDDISLRLTETAGNYQGAFINYHGVSNVMYLGVHDASDAVKANDVNVISITRSNGAIGLLKNTAITGTLKTSGDLTVGTFKSGWAGTGASIGSDGVAEFKDVFIRGGLTLNELIVNQIRGTNGDLVVSDTAKIESVTGNVITIEGESGDYNPFRVGDVILCQRFKASDSSSIKLYKANVTAVSVKTITVKMLAGSNISDVSKGDVIVRYTSTNEDRKGILYLASSASGAPYADVVFDGSTKVRLGKLDGIGKLTGYGLYGENVHLTGYINATSGEFSGKITASSGAIGGWGIASNTLSSGNLSLTSSGSIKSNDKTNTYWQLNNDGSGLLAKSSLIWTSTGDVTLGVGNNSITYNATSGKITMGTNVTMGWGSITGISVTGTQISNGAISTAKLAAGAVTASKIETGAIGLTQLADEVKAKLADAFDNDNILTPTEKQNITMLWNNIVAEFAVIIETSKLYIGSHLQNGVSAAVTALEKAYSDLHNHLYVNTLYENTEPLLANINTPSNVVGTVLRSLFTTYYTCNENLIKSQGSTLITGGFLKTDIIEAGSIKANMITVDNIITIGKTGVSAGGKLEIYNGPTKVVDLGGPNNKIGNWLITSNSIQTGNYNTANTMYFGVSGISLGTTFRVSAGGSLTATSGTIGGWTITNQISNGNVILSSNGTILYENYWRLGYDGAGYVAKTNISWTSGGAVTIGKGNSTINISAAGAITLGSAVTIGWASVSNVSITGTQINSNAITTTHIGANQIITQAANIKDAVITNAKISDLNANKINAGTISADRIAAGSISANKLAGKSITADYIKSGAIGYNELSSDVKAKLDAAFDSDTVLTPSEKQSVLQIWTDIESTHQIAIESANHYQGNPEAKNIDSEIEALSVAYNTVYAYLFITIHPSNTTPLLGDVNVSSTVDANALRQTISYYFTCYENLAKAKGSTIINGGYLQTEIIKANSVHADKIVAGSIEAKHIKANSITSGLIDTTNLIVKDTAKIGNFTISGGNLTGGSGASAVGLSTSGIWLGGSSTNAPFRVTSAGAVTASNISISGGSLNINNTFNVTSAGAVTASNISISGGSLNINNVFKVTSAGAVTASNISITGGALNINNMFKVTSAGALTTTSGSIAGWSITQNRIQKGDFSGSSTTPTFYIQQSDSISGYFYNGTGTLQGYGLYWYKSSNAGHIILGQVASNGYTVKSNFYGLQMMSWDGTEYFCLSANTNLSGGKEVYNKIGGWAFDHESIYCGQKQASNAFATSGITIHSTGAIRSKNFRIDTDGNAFFNGHIVAASGTIGGFNISGTDLTSTNVAITPTQLTYTSDDNTFSVKNGSLTTNNVVLNGIIEGNKWNVSSEGIASFSDLNVSNISAVGGTIGGWNITSSSLYGGERGAQTSIPATGSIFPDKVSNASYGASTFGNVNTYTIAQSETSSNIVISGAADTKWTVTVPQFFFEFNNALKKNGSAYKVLHWFCEVSLMNGSTVIDTRNGIMEVYGHGSGTNDGDGKLYYMSLPSFTKQNLAPGTYKIVATHKLKLAWNKNGTSNNGLVNGFKIKTPVNAKAVYSQESTYASLSPSEFIIQKSSDKYFKVAITDQSVDIYLKGDVYGNTINGEVTRAQSLYVTVGGNDFARVIGGETASNSGYLELSTADDGAEPIYVRQYTGQFTTLARSATLLDATGNTSFPGSVTAKNFIKSGSNDNYILLGGGGQTTVSSFATASHNHSDLYYTKGEDLGTINNSRSGMVNVEYGLTPAFYGNRMIFIKPSDIIVEKAPRGTNNWTVWAELSDYAKGSLFDGKANGGFGWTKSEDIRITITDTDRYCTLDRMYAWFNSAGATFTFNVDFINSAGERLSQSFENTGNVSGWSGPMFIRHHSVAFSTSTNGGQAKKIVITIRVNLAGNNNDTTYPNIAINSIQWYGGSMWTMPNGMMKTGQLYDWDYNQNVTFPANITSNGSIESTSDSYNFYANNTTQTWAYMRLKSGNIFWDFATKDNDDSGAFQIRQSGSSTDRFIFNSVSNMGDKSLEFWRGTNASWRLLNTGGIFKIQSNYTTGVTSYYDVVSLNYNNGNAAIKGSLTAKSFGYDATMSMSPEMNNEVNFGGTNGSNTIFFGYRAKDSKPIPSIFVFGGSTGTATIKAGGFMVGATSVSLDGHTHSYLPLTGGILTGNIFMPNLLIDYKTSSRGNTPQLIGYRGTLSLNDRVFANEGGWSWTTYDSSTQNAPQGAVSNANGVMTMNTHSGSTFTHQLSFNSSNQIHHRVSTGAWSRLCKFGDNIGVGSTEYASGDHRHGNYMSTIAYTGTGNAITSATLSGNTLTFDKSTVFYHGGNSNNDSTDWRAKNSTVSGNLNVIGTQTEMASHYYHKLYSNGDTVYVHYYPTGAPITKPTFANFRFADGKGSYKVLAIGGDGMMNWNNKRIYHAGNSNKSDVDWMCRRLLATSGYTEYTADGLFNAKATTSTISTPSGSLIKMGYWDNGTGLYNPRMGFSGAGKNWSLGIHGTDGGFHIGRGNDVNNSDLFINSTTGHVGIGTVTPTDKLHLYSGNNTLISSAIQNSEGKLTLGVDTDGSGFIWHVTNAPLRFATNNTEKLRILSNGNVGINESNPLDKLVVGGYIKAIASGFKIETLGTGWGAWERGMSWHNNDASNTRIASFVAGGSNGTTSNSGFIFRLAEVEKFRILQNHAYFVGNLGIGTTDPRARLHVVGDICTSTGIITGEIGSNSHQIQLGISGRNYMELDEYGGDFRFNRSTSSKTELMRLNPTGLGIGCVASEKLDVNGNIKGTRVISGTYNNTSYAMSTSSFICSSWVRTTGNSGWYNETYGGGICQTESSTVKIYNSKKLKVESSASDSLSTSGGVQSDSGEFRFGSEARLKYNSSTKSVQFLFD